ncbi:hypothetical protein NB636_05415 [Oxalobacter aliiformigenes]|uniref:hypothetical protein n=2 Tax=Oxalobacter aliiformigenes TaxID=2946593 RepID=UPI0022B03EC6|nr:hypothetical protein [Oxalobacter aliiformigenes]WAW00284.1 hypothetical protein NB636_05415 [Oxalobacter aliiformigenes]
MMSTQTKSQVVGSFIEVVFVCFLAIGVILDVTYGSRQKAEFNPLPCAVGSVYDADTFLALSTRHAGYDADFGVSRG